MGLCQPFTFKRGCSYFCFCSESIILSRKLKVFAGVYFEETVHLAQQMLVLTACFLSVRSTFLCCRQGLAWWHKGLSVECSRPKGDDAGSKLAESDVILQLGV